MTGPAPLSTSRKRAVLITCCTAILISTMDSTIVNLALPTIGRELHASLSHLQWVVDGYTLTLASLLLLSGAIADRFGRRRVFQIGLTVFAAGSLLCSLAPNIEVLIAARFLQAVGGSMLNPVAMSIITVVFTDRVERARAIGVWGAVVGVSTAVGPIVGGTLIDSLGWRSIFWINLPICALALVLTAAVVPESRSASARRLDPIGQVLAVLVLATLVFALIERRPLLLLVTAAAFAAFLWHENRHRAPFIDLRFFRSFPFSAATMTAIVAFAGFGAFLFTMSIYLQSTRQLSAVSAGLVYLPMALAVLVMSPLSGRLVGRYGARPSMVSAGAVMTVAAVLLALIGDDTPIPVVAAVMAVFGIGFGLVNAPITNAAVSGMPIDRAGAAAAVATTSRQIGISVGVALCGVLAGAALWSTVAVAMVGVIVLGVVSTGAAADRSLRRVAPLFDDDPVTRTEAVSDAR
ncbi:MFS transporter [Gordonia sp. PP30]|uniref:MFS transporter n=1 Tax=unclassified Gordonia (in: high G+C Gram-positive bacteria) TaxID=2657482 RepID=UPI001FFF4A9A|nr:MULTISPECIES: MFS transporter [unclassified Gordonia (in: high G+C Gram-positive bacteria)]UQE76900.1 MFS transporter [Gordonia sp. PP30]